VNIIPVPSAWRDGIGGCEVELLVRQGDTRLYERCWPACYVSHHDGGGCER
jgi:hypothetical protein